MIMASIILFELGSSFYPLNTILVKIELKLSKQRTKFYVRDARDFSSRITIQGFERMKFFKALLSEGKAGVCAVCITMNAH